MNSAVLAAIGDELLSGARLEKNCNFMAKIFHNYGVEVKRIEIISDEEEQIQNLLSRWIGKTDLLIMSGGLGPTHDDKTRYAIAKFLGCELESDSLYDKILERVKDDSKRYERIRRSRDTQSMIPVKATAVYNPLGSALGISFTQNNTKVIALPGVPMEYEAMTRQELPEIFSGERENYACASIIILGLPELSVAKKIPEVINNSSLHISILPAFPQVELIIRGDKKLVEEAENLTRSRFIDVLPKGCKSLSEAVFYQAKLTGKKIAFAESCTGGLLGESITEFSGSSEVFNGSAVTYSNEAKINILGVHEDTIKKFGAVSEECAREMSEGAMKIYNADFAVSVTGIAGPDGGTESKPVGTVCFGLSSKNSQASFTKKLPGNRNEVRIRSLRFAMAELWRMIKNDKADPVL